MDNKKVESNFFLIKVDCLKFNFKWFFKAELEEQDWEKDLPEDLDSISAEELEKEINQMIQ